MQLLSLEGRGQVRVIKNKTSCLLTFFSLKLNLLAHRGKVPACITNKQTVLVLRVNVI
jgi:hypothetical protein